MYLLRNQQTFDSRNYIRGESNFNPILVDVSSQILQMQFEFQLCLVLKLQHF